MTPLITGDLKMASVHDSLLSIVCSVVAEEMFVVVASSNSSLTTKFCACAYIEFLAGTCFWPVGNTYTKQYNTEDAKNFQASSAIQMHNHSVRAAKLP